MSYLNNSAHFVLFEQTSISIKLSESDRSWYIDIIGEKSIKLNLYKDMSFFAFSFLCSQFIIFIFKNFNIFLAIHISIVHWNSISTYQKNSQRKD